MTTKSHRFTSVVASTVLAAALGAATLVPAEAQAQEADSPSVSPTGKGIAGGVLLGAEVVMIPIAIAGVKAWWPYVVFGAVGAGGGAVGGWAVEQVDSSEPSLYMLAGGMALVVPTVVAVLNATAYDPAEEQDEEGADPGEVEGEVEMEMGARYPGGSPVPMSVVGVDAWSKRPAVALGVPAVNVKPRFSPTEVSTYGVEQGTEVTIPVVSGSF